MAGGASRDLVVNLIGKTDQLRRAFTSGLGGLSTSTLAKGGLVGAVAAVGVGVAVGLESIGSNFDEAYDRIRAGTGATGSELESLTGSFDRVFASGPNGFQDVGTAITDLNSRLGLTGRPLEDVAKNVLDLSRITGTDLSSNIESVTRLFGDWGIANEDMVGTMDELFRASQDSGVPVERLADLAVRAGAPLRGLGFGFEETIALMAKFEREGVNTELVLGGMRTGLGRLAKAGEDAPTTFRRIVEQIKNAGSVSKANALAIELFGQRAGPDMADAIRAGRFDLDSYLDTIMNGTETIQSADDAVGDWRESWQTLKNKVFVALRPIAKGFFDALGNGMKVIEEKGLGGAIVRGLQNLGEAVKDGAGELVSLGAQFGNWILDGITGFWFGTAVPWFKSLPGRIAEAVPDLANLLKNKGWDLIRGLWQRAQDFWTSTLQPFLANLPGEFVTAIGDLVDTLKTAGWNLIRGLWQRAQDFWTSTLQPFLTNLPSHLKAAVGDLASLLASAGWNLIRGLWSKAQEFWTSTLHPFLTNLPSHLKAAVGDLASTLASAGWQLIYGLWQKAQEFWTTTLYPFLSNLPGRMATAVGALIKTLFQKGVDLLTGLRNGAIEFWNTFYEWLRGLPGRIANAVPYLGNVLWFAGIALGNGLKAGFELALAGVVAVFQTTVDGIIRAYNSIPLLPNVGGGSSPTQYNVQLPPGSVSGGGDKGKVFAHGGWVPGTGPVPIIAHGGEFVLSHEMLSRGFSTGGGGDMYVTVQMPPGSNGEDIYRQLVKIQRRRGPLALSVR